MELRVRRISKTALLPTRAHKEDAGLDLYADCEGHVEPGSTELIGTGVAVEIPSGYVGMVCTRSGMACRSSVSVLNAPGIIDSGYQGEVKVILHNHGRNGTRIVRGDRIAQLVLAPIALPTVVLTTEVGLTDRGTGGFGSTGS